MTRPRGPRAFTVSVCCLWLWKTRDKDRQREAKGSIYHLMVASCNKESVGCHSPSLQVEATLLPGCKLPQAARCIPLSAFFLPLCDCDCECLQSIPALSTLLQQPPPINMRPQIPSFASQKPPKAKSHRSSQADRSTPSNRAS